MKTLVAYFSPTGTTEKVAKALAHVCGADLFTIEPEVSYTKEDLNWRDENSRSTVEMKDPSSRPAIAHCCTNIREYDLLFVGFPIWWYIAPTIINTFLESCDLTGMTIVPFATSGGSGMGRTNEMLAPSCKGAVLVDGKVMPGNISEKDLITFAKEYHAL